MPANRVIAHSTLGTARTVAARHIGPQPTQPTCAWPLISECLNLICGVICRADLSMVRHSKEAGNEAACGPAVVCRLLVHVIRRAAIGLPSQLGVANQMPRPISLMLAKKFDTELYICRLSGHETLTFIAASPASPSGPRSAATNLAPRLRPHERDRVEVRHPLPAPHAPYR